MNKTAEASRIAGEDGFSWGRFPFSAGRFDCVDTANGQRFIMPAAASSAAGRRGMQGEAGAIDFARRGNHLSLALMRKPGGGVTGGLRNYPKANGYACQLGRWRQTVSVG
jgi:hypothetical protein